MSEYFIRVDIADTKGKDFEGWYFIDNFTAVLDEDFTSADLDTITFKIRKSITDYEKGRK